MTVITDYPTLKTELTDELLRAGDQTFARRLPRIIAQAELAIERELRVPELETSATLNLTAATATTAAPADLLEAISVTLLTATPRPMDAMEGQALEMMYGGRANSTPEVYALFASTFTWGPTPDATTTARLRYYKQIPKLTDAAPTNALLTRYWDLYFYGSLLAASPGLGDDARIRVWGELYTQAMATAMQIQNATNVRSQFANARAAKTYGKLS